MYSEEADFIKKLDILSRSVYPQDKIERGEFAALILKMLKIEEEYEVLNLNYLEAIEVINDKLDIVLLDPPYKNDIYLF